MKTPDLSFVIPVFNGQEYLALALASCMGQSHRNIEAVVVDDGSTDATKRIIKWYAERDERVRPIYLEKNQGSGHARNVGSSEAKSPFIAMLDSDDENENRRAAVTLDLFKIHGDCLVYGSCVILNHVGMALKTLLASPFNKEESLKAETNFIPHSSMSYPKSHWERHPYDEGDYAKNGIEDWLFQHVAFKSGLKFIHTEKILCGIRYNVHGITSNRDPKRPKELKAKFLETMNEVVKA